MLPSAAGRGSPSPVALASVQKRPSAALRPARPSADMRLVDGPVTVLAPRAPPAASSPDELAQGTAMNYGVNLRLDWQDLGCPIPVRGARLTAARRIRRDWRRSFGSAPAPRCSHPRAFPNARKKPAGRRCSARGAASRAGPGRSRLSTSGARMVQMGHRGPPEAYVSHARGQGIRPRERDINGLRHPRRRLCGTRWTTRARKVARCPATTPVQPNRDAVALSRRVPLGCELNERLFAIEHVRLCSIAESQIASVSSTPPQGNQHMQLPRTSGCIESDTC